MTKEGLLFSLTNLKVYALNNLKNNPKKDKKDTKPICGMVYDDFFLIFGNSEIRIKSGEKKIFSNFGINNAYFFSKGDNVNVLFGQGKQNEVEIIDYEIHEIFFDG